MLKSRNFIIGLGMGFILSGIIIIIYSSIISKDLLVYNKDYTIEELKVLAKQENLYIYTEEELNIFKIELQANYSNEGMANIVSSHFTIPSGFTSIEVAEYLYEVGILKDKEEFINILDEKKLSTKVIAKTYEYDNELSTEELIELITGTSKAGW